MGLFDYVIMDRRVPVPVEYDHSKYEWQTKDIDRPLMRTFKIDRKGRLLQAEFHVVPGEERELPWMDEPFVTRKRVFDGWVERIPHGVYRISGPKAEEEEYRDFWFKFTNGELREVLTDPLD